jgi:hypothetical protein
MRKLIFITASVLAMLAFSSGRITAADEEQTFLGSGRVYYENNWQKVSGSMLRVYGYGADTYDPQKNEVIHMFKMFQVTGSTNILDSNGKATDVDHSARCGTLEVTYTGKKEPYLAVKVECLTEQAFYLKDPRYAGERRRDQHIMEARHKQRLDDIAYEERERRRKHPEWWAAAEERDRKKADTEKRIADEAKAKADAADEEAQQQFADEARAKAGAAEEKEQDVPEKADAAEQPRNGTAEKELDAAQAQEKAPAADEKEQDVPEKAQAAPEEQQQEQPAEDEPTPGPH